MGKRPRRALTYRGVLAVNAISDQTFLAESAKTLAARLTVGNQVHER
jgi:hypothetical protein